MTDENKILEALTSDEFDIMTKIVKNHKTSGAIYVSKEYIGKKAIIILRNKDEDEGTDS